MLALFALLRSSCGWVTLSQVRFGAQLETIQQQTKGTYTGSAPLIQRLGFVWSLPPVRASAEGLGGGIAWAWDSSLCDALLPRFHEDLLGFRFVNCQTLQAAVHRGFASWADNHPTISFIDVTDQCEAMGDLSPSCPLVELWVTSLKPEAGTGTQSGANLTATQVAALTAGPNGALSASGAKLASSLGSVSELGDAKLTAATATPSAKYSANFYWTSGIPAAGGSSAPMIETYKAVIAFNVEESFCWYLDSDFCSGFHSLKKLATPSNILLGFRCLVYGLWGVTLLVVVVQLAFLVRPQLSTQMTLRQRVRAVLAVLSTWSVLGTALRVLLTVTPPLFFELIFLPCFECYDFEAAATHEVGHVLGFSHPDASEEGTCCGFAPGKNVHHAALAAGNRSVQSSDFCRDPWRGVREGVYTGATDVSVAGGVRESIMKAFTQHTPRVCLSPDDLEGLNVLYPHCDALLLHSEPVCFKIQHNIGFVRLGAFILIPMLLSMCLLLMCNALVRKHHLLRIRSRELQIKSKDIHIIGVESQCATARQSISMLQSQILQAEVTEAMRVEAKANAKARVALDDYARAVEEACGPSVAAALRRVQADTEAGRMAAAAASAEASAPRKAAARAPARRTAGAGGIISWVARASGLDRFTDKGDRSSASEGSQSHQTRLRKFRRGSGSSGGIASAENSAAASSSDGDEKSGYSAGSSSRYTGKSGHGSPPAPSAGSRHVQIRPASVSATSAAAHESHSMPLSPIVDDSAAAGPEASEARSYVSG